MSKWLSQPSYASLPPKHHIWERSVQYQVFSLLCMKKSKSTLKERAWEYLLVPRRTKTLTSYFPEQRRNWVAMSSELTNERDVVLPRKGSSKATWRMSSIRFSTYYYPLFPFLCALSAFPVAKQLLSKGSAVSQWSFPLYQSLAHSIFAGRE